MPWHTQALKIFKKFCFTFGVWLFYSVALVSAVQQSESAMCIQTSQPSQTSLPATHHPTSLVISEHPAELSVLYSFPLAILGFPCGSAGKESACNVGDLGSIPGLGRSPEEGEGYSLQYSCLVNSMDRRVGHD